MTAAIAGAPALVVPAPAPLPNEAAQGVIPPGGDPKAGDAMLRSLLLLDPAIARWSRQRKRREMLKRLWSGIANHFRLRATEWFGCAVLLQLGKTLYFPPPAFPHSESWDVMAAMMSEESWGLIFLAIGALRLAALTVNGTFKGFRFSPHIRCATAFLAAGLWLQVVLSMLEAAPNGTGYVVYRLILLLELYNVWRSAADAGHVAKGSAR